jgi:hypothetical protein
MGIMTINRSTSNPPHAVSGIPITSEDGPALGTVFLPTPRILVFIPTTSNPPQRIPFPARMFAAFESWMDEQGWGWSRLPGLALGSYPSKELGVVRDECRVYCVLTPTLIVADEVGARIYAYVAEHFAQESVFLSCDAVPTTLFSNPLSRGSSLDLGLICVTVEGSCPTIDSLRALLHRDTVDLCERRLSDGRLEFAALCPAGVVGGVFVALDAFPGSTFRVLSPDVGWGERVSNFTLPHSCDRCNGDIDDVEALRESLAACTRADFLARPCPEEPQ